MKYVEEIREAKSIYLIDTNHFGLGSHGAAYIIDAERKAIIETGMSYSVERILKGLNELEAPPAEVAYIMVTHIHLDHAGGAGFLVSECPNAKVVVHQKGADYLIDPSPLVKSVERATGVMFEKYGDVKPIPAERIIRVSGGETFDLGKGFKVEAIDTAGHAPHHACYYEHQTRGLFVGDAAGIYRQDADRLLLTTPPPSFHPTSSLKVLEQLKRLEPEILFYTHFGPHQDPVKMLDEYAELLKEWVREIEKLRKKLGDDEAVKTGLVKKYGPSYQGYYNARAAKHEIMMNAQGVLLYLDKYGR